MDALVWLFYSPDDTDVAVTLCETVANARGWHVISLANTLEVEKVCEELRHVWCDSSGDASGRGVLVRHCTSCNHQSSVVDLCRTIHVHKPPLHPRFIAFTHDERLLDTCEEDDFRWLLLDPTMSAIDVYTRSLVCGMGCVIGQSERLEFRNMDVVADSAFIGRLITSDEWIRFIGERGSDGAAYILKNMCFGLYVVSFRKFGKQIGVCGLMQRAFLPCRDLGYAFCKEFVGKGLASESAQFFLRRAQVCHEKVLAMTKS
jgi:RimJ/RimL family protein N-acetyltransferase